MSFEKCRSRAKRKEEREELEETEAGRELNSSINMENGRYRYDSRSSVHVCIACSS